MFPKFFSDKPKHVRLLIPRLLGIIHLVCTHEGGRGAKQMRTRGGGGWHMKYVRKAKNYQLFEYILQQLINEVRIQVKLLLVQGCQADGPQAESDNVAPRNFE